MSNKTNSCHNLVFSETVGLYQIYFYYFSETVGVVLHKDSKWYQSWQNFRDNNQYVNSKY